MFGQVLDKLDTFFGRAFLLARYVPWLLCVLANLLFACLAFPAIRSLAAKAYEGATTDRIFDLLLLLLGVWVVAYVTSPLVQFVTAFLEGNWMPVWLARATVLTHARRRDRLELKDRLLFNRRTPDSKKVIEALKADREIGSRHRKIGDPGAIDRAEAVIAGLRAARWLNKPIELADFEHADSALSKALRNNNAEADLFLDKREKGLAGRLHALHEEMVRNLVPYSLDIAEQTEQRSHSKLERLFAHEELAPTRLGNDAAALRSYCQTRYGIEFEFFWPRFLLVVQKDAKLRETIAMAKIQLDFSVLALGLSAITVAVWSLILALVGRSLLAGLVVIAIGPLVVYVWLGIVHASYATFADMVRSAIDLHRFEVLVGLRYPLPASTDDERRCWEAVNRLTLLDEHRTNVAFKHPAP